MDRITVATVLALVHKNVVYDIGCALGRAYGL